MSPVFDPDEERPAPPRGPTIRCPVCTRLAVIAARGDGEPVVAVHFGTGGAACLGSGCRVRAVPS